MKITCSISKKNLLKLAAVIYKDIEQTKGDSYDARVLMERLFEKLIVTQGDEVALSYMQQMPYLIGQIAFKENTDLINDFGIDTIFKLNKEFRNEESGIQSLVNFFGKSIDIDTLKILADDKINNPEQEPIVEIPEEKSIEKFTDQRLKVTLDNAISTTFEEFIEMNPDSKVDETIENIDPSKITIYNTLDRLRSANRDTTAFDTFILDDTKVKLRVWSLFNFPQDLLYPYTKDLKERINAFKNGTAKDQGNVKPVTEQYMTVLTNEKGQILYFTETGLITTKEKGGKPVYQMLRDVRIENNIYRITDIYGLEDMILGALQSAQARIKQMGYKSIDVFEKAEDITFSDFVNQIEKERQDKFKEYYDFRESLKGMPGNKQIFLPIIDISKGLPNGRVKISNTKLNLNNLSLFTPEQAADILKSLFILDTPLASNGEIIEATHGVVNINGELFNVDRPDVSKELAIKIAKVLTSKTLDYNEKLIFHNQFFSSNMSSDVRRHTLLYNSAKKELIFSYNEFTGQEWSAIQQNKDNKITKNNILEIDLNNAEVAEAKIVEILLNSKAFLKKDNNKFVFDANGKPTVIKYYPAKIKYDKSLLKDNSYFDYVENPNKPGDYMLEVKSYKTELLPTLDAKIDFKNAKSIPLYNSYIIFAIPNAFSKSIDEIKEENEIKGEPSEIRKKYNELVDILKNSPDQNPSLKATVTKLGQITQSPTGNYRSVDVTIEGQEGTFKLYKVLDNTAKVGDEINLILKDIDVQDGMGYLNTIAGVKVFEGRTYDFGLLQNTDYANKELPLEPVILKTETVKIEKDETEIEDITDTQSTDGQSLEIPINPNQPSDSPIGRIFKGEDPGFLDRRVYLTQAGVTQQQIDDATDWWSKSILNKYIDISVAAGLVNSDVYARFIAKGAFLLKSNDYELKEGKLGVIAFNPLSGSNYVDVYHEAWHVFSQLFLTNDQKIKLYTEFGNSNKAYKNKSFFELEEILAENFREYARNPKPTKSQPVKNTIFRKILNFLKKLFANVSPKDIIDSNIMEIDSVSELFDALYMNNAAVLNKYSPSVDNLMWDSLDRGVIVKTSEKDSKGKNIKEEILNNQDSKALSATIDSLLSEIIDENSNFTNKKSGTVKILTNDINKTKAYNKILEIFEEDLKKWRKELLIKDVEFDTYDTIELLESNAIGIIRSKKGDHKYIFLRGQIESFKNLTADTKLGEREKGKLYKDNIEIIADYYQHDKIKDDTGDFADILIVDSIEEAQEQYNSYIEIDNITKKQKAPSITTLELKQVVSRLYTPEQQITLDNIRIYETALKHWNSVIAYHKDNSVFDIIKEKYILLEDDPDAKATLNPSKAQEARTGDKSIGEFTLQQMANKETIYILKSLFKKEKKGKDYIDVYDRFGNKQLADFRSVWNAVVRATNSAKDPQKIYDSILEASSFFPELKQLIKHKLPNPNQIDPITLNFVKQSSSEFDITTAFFTDFSRPKIPYIQLLAFIENGEYTTEVTDAGIDVSKTLKIFDAKFKSDKSDAFIEKTNNISKLNLEAIINNFKNKNNADIFDDNKAFRFLTSIGFYLDDLIVIKEEIANVNKRNYYNVARIYETIKLIHEAGQDPNLSKEARNFIEKFRMQPLIELRKGIPPNLLGAKNSKLYTSGLSQKTIIDRIISLQNLYGRTGSSFSVLNPERNRVNLHTDDNTATVIADAINRVNEKSDMWSKTEFRLLNYFNPAVNSFTNRSQIIKALFEVNNKKRKDRSLEIMMVSGTQLTFAEEFLSGTSTTNLDGQGKLLQDFHTFLKSGVLEFLRPGSKSSSFGFILRGGMPIDVKGLGKNKEPYLYADIDDFLISNNKENKVIERIILPYLAAELERINRYKENPQAKNYTGYNLNVNNSGKKSGEDFAIFDGILNESTKTDLLEKINNSSIDLINYLSNDVALKDTLIKQIKGYFSIRSEEIKLRINEGKYIDPAVYSKVVGNLSNSQKEDVLSKAFMYNYWIHSVETQILFLGDISQYNHLKEELHKRTSGLISNGPRFRTDTAAQFFINNKDGWAQNTYASTLASEYQNFEYDGTLNTAVIEDISRDSVYLNIIKKGLEKDYKKRYALLPTAEAQKLLEERVAKEIAKYRADEIKEGDGQGYITVDAYRALKKLQNRWSDAQEQLYKKIIAGGEITTKDYIELFPPYKLQYFGPLVAKSADYTTGTVLPVTAFHKFALVPLVPSWIKGGDLEILHEEMLRNNIQYATFGSGSKVNTVTSNGNLDQIYEPGSDNKKIKSKINFTKNVIHVEYLKEVASVPSKMKGKVIFSTQLRKLILEGLFIKGELATGVNKDLVEGYTSLVDSYTKLLKEELLTEIGYTKENGIYVGKPAKLLKLIKDNLAKKDYPNHLLDVLKTNSDGSLKYDLSNFVDAQTIEKTVLAIAENRFVKQKLNGEALVQVASSMTNGIWSAGNKFRAGNNEDILKYMGTNNLPFYYPGEDGKTNAMKVAIALQGDFFNLLNLNHLDGQPIKTRQRLNEMIKEDEWLNKDNNRKAVTMTAVRIPVQGLNSMEFMEVWEFLDPSASNILIPPTELVAKSGGDYDVDKLTTFMPNIDKNGNIYSSKSSGKDLLKALETITGSDKMALIKEIKKVMENDLITSIRSILELPQNYANLVRPNDTYMLKDIADELADVVSDYDRFQTVNNKINEYKIVKNKKAISATTTLEPLYNIEKFNGNMIGKAVLGIAANENAFSPLFNSIGAKMPLTYIESEFKDATNRYEDVVDGEVYKTRLLLNKNLMPDGSISLSDINSSDYINQIAELFSQGMNGWVDVEKDQWVFYIQGNLEIAPILLYLFKAGVPVREAIMFVSTPLIREYATKQRLLKSPYATLMGIAPAEPQFAQYQAATDVLESTIASYFDRELKKTNFDSNKYDNVTISYYGIDSRGYKKLTKESLIVKNNEEVESFVEDFILYNSIADITAIDYSNSKNQKEVQNIYTKPKLDNKKIYSSAVKLSENTVNKFGNFDPKAIEILVKSKNDSDKYSDLSIATFLHFIEIEKYLKGLGNVKRITKVDTQINNSVQELFLREMNKNYLDDYSKVDKETLNKLLDDSILSALGDKEIIKDIISPLFSLRNNKLILQQLVKSINTQSTQIKKRYNGLGRENISKFIEEYKNAVNNFILQNFLSNNLNENGQFVLVPDDYKGLKVVINENLETDVEIIEKNGSKIIRVNPKRIDADFKNKNYLITSSSTNAYKSRDLVPFQVADDVFESKSSYYSYVIEREYLKYKGYTKEEINSIALLNTYNPSVILRKGTYSFTTQLLDVIQEFPELSKYPVVNQLSLYPFSNDFNIITLNDKDLLDGAQSDIYAQNIRELANPKIQKIENAKDNKKVSILFSMLQLLATYQHGVGPTKSGLNEQIPQDAFLSVMNNASALFINNYFNENTLKYIADILLADKLNFKNYVMPDDNFSMLIAAEAEGAQPSTSVDNTNKPILNSLPNKSSVPTMTYAGIGSRQTPQKVLDKMTEVAKYLDGLGYTLQTGFTFKNKETNLDEEGADKAFSDGSKNKTLFGPYGIRKTVKGLESADKYNEAVTEKSSAIVKEIHPAPDRLTPGAIKLMARNTNQIFGKDLNNTVDFVLFYAEETSNPLRPKGGTGQAVEMARRKGIPTINMADTNWRDQLKTVLAKPTQPATEPTAPQSTTVKYKYYGAMYDILVEDEVGIDVLNYRGKPAKKAILLAYFNQNPNVDPQSGLSTELVLDDEENLQLNLGTSNPTTGNTFTFADGSVVETPFKLNQEQEAALLKLEEFYNNPQKFNNEITLIGYAGTGKTSIMTIFDKWLNKGWFGPNVVYTAPTHRANAVTKLKNPKIKVLTLHSLFGFGPEVDFEGMDYDVKDLQYANNRNGKIERGQILIVDESSMITDELYDFLGQQKGKYDLKVIYMGDPGQLGPVQNKGGLTSKVFSNPTTSVTLTKVERTGDNPILKESTALRSGGSLSYQSDEINGKGVEYINNTARENQILAENLNEMRNSENYLYFRILAATNPEVARLNKTARQILYPQNYQEQLVVGEILMGYDNFGRDYKTGQSLLYNSGDYMITSLKKDIKQVYTSNYEQENGKFVQKDLLELKFTGYEVTLKNLLDPESIPFEVFIPDIVGNDDASTKLADTIHKLNYMGKIATSGQDKARYFEKASNLSKQLLFMHDVKGLTDKSKIKKAIDYGYAHTIHKSQGGTYTKVFINDPSITGLVGYIKDRRRLTDDQAATVERQLKYVAVSRATDYVYISTNKGASGKPTQMDDPTQGDFNTIGTFNLSEIDPPVTSIKLDTVNKDNTRAFINKLPIKKYTTEHGNYKYHSFNKANEALLTGIKEKTIFTQPESFYILERVTLNAETKYHNSNLNGNKYLVDTKNKKIYEIDNDYVFRFDDGGLYANVPVDVVASYKQEIINNKDTYAPNSSLDAAIIANSKPVRSSVSTNIAKFEGQMTFAYGQNKRAGIIANTTFDAILNGERTASTRYEGEGNIEYWKKAKVGDIITWESADGRTVDVEVTRPLHKLVGSGKTPIEWSELEGWSISYFNEKVKPKLDKAWEIEFKLIPSSSQFKNNDPFEDDQTNNCSTPF